MVVQAQYLMLLCSFREQLQQHVRVHAVEAVMACREIEQSLQDLTGKQAITSMFHFINQFTFNIIFPPIVSSKFLFPSPFHFWLHLRKLGYCFLKICLSGALPFSPCCW